MKVFVTGHRGFVGKKLVKKLEELGHDVVTSEINLKYEHWVDATIADEKPDWVFHCAAVVGGIARNMKEPYKFLYDNLQIQNNVINSCLQNKVKKVLFLGSSCIYPKDYRQPLVETDLLAAPLEPTNEGYAIAKIAGLKLCEYANRTQDTTKFVSLMPCNLYGPGDHFDLERSHVLSALVKKIVDAKDNDERTVEIWGTGNPRREWLHVSDLVDGMIWAMENIEKTDTHLNIGTGVDISIRELAEGIAAYVGFEGKLFYNTSKPDGMLRKCLDVSKINNLGWRARIGIRRGLINTIEHYRVLKGVEHD